MCIRKGVVSYAAPKSRRTVLPTRCRITREYGMIAQTRYWDEREPPYRSLDIYFVMKSATSIVARVSTYAPPYPLWGVCGQTKGDRGKRRSCLARTLRHRRLGQEMSPPTYAIVPYHICLIFCFERAYTNPDTWGRRDSQCIGLLCGYVVLGCVLRPPHRKRVKNVISCLKYIRNIPPSSSNPVHTD